MSNYFYHPLQDIASKYVDGTANSSDWPRTRDSHGFSKLDFGVGGGIKVYSMTNGEVVNCGWFGSDGVSKNGCVVKTSDCGYSKMQAKLQGGEAADYPLYFTYIEMDELNPNLKKGDTIKQGDWIGVTNSEYAGSNLHFDIQPYDRYGGEPAPPKAKPWMGDISFNQIDAYGDKGSNFYLKKYLDSNFSLDKLNNIKDKEGNYLGVKGEDGLYYPPSSSDTPVTQNTGLNTGGSDPNLQVSRWYSYMIMLQKPIAMTSKTEGGTIGNVNADIPKGYYTDIINITDDELNHCCNTILGEIPISEDGVEDTLQGYMLYAKLIRVRYFYKDTNPGGSIMSVINNGGFYGHSGTSISSTKVAACGLTISEFKEYVKNNITQPQFFGFQSNSKELSFAESGALYNYGYYGLGYTSNTSNVEAEIEEKIKNDTIMSHSHPTMTPSVKPFFLGCIGNTGYWMHQ